MILEIQIVLEFYNKYICGVRGGLPFKSVKRLDPESDKCPDGT